jgi:hypothetical protein
MIVTFHERKNVVLHSVQTCDVCNDEFVRRRAKPTGMCLECIQATREWQAAERRHRAKCKEAGVRA